MQGGKIQTSQKYHNMFSNILKLIAQEHAWFGYFSILATAGCSAQCCHDPKTQLEIHDWN